MTDYKYRKVRPEDEEQGKVVFAKVISQPHWEGRPKRIVDNFPIGAITWFKRNYVKFDVQGLPHLEHNRSVIPEANRHRANIDPSCFELLVTSTKKVR